jgi:NitT/TauT family transport system permease protein
VFVHVIFPETLPQIVNSIKVGTAISWAVVVAAELVAAQYGLGHMIIDAATFFRVADVYVGIVFIGLVGFVLEQIIIWLENRFVHWSGK